MVARFGENDFGGEDGLIQRGNHASAPLVPLVARREAADQRAGINEIPDRRSLHASRGRAARFLSFRERGACLLQTSACPPAQAVFRFVSGKWCDDFFLRPTLA